MQCDCGTISAATAKSLFRGQAVQCNICAVKGQTGPNSRGWRGGRHTPLTHYNKFLRGAARRGIEWHLALDDIDSLFERQAGLCALSGVPITFDHGQRNGVANGNASLDRIDNTVGYLPGNIQLVTKDINMGKQTLTNAQFIAMCKSVVSYVENRGIV